jgi:hypothetical protein
MPRYFFHLYECGTMIRDDDGRELSDAGPIRDLAIREALDVMAGEVQAGSLCLSCRIEVMDEKGQPVFVLPFKEALKVTGW